MDYDTLHLLIQLVMLLVQLATVIYVHHQHADIHQFKERLEGNGNH